MPRGANTPRRLRPEGALVLVGSSWKCILQDVAKEPLWSGLTDGATAVM